MTYAQAYCAALEAAAKVARAYLKNNEAAEAIAERVECLLVPEDDSAKCHDCGRPYGNEHGFPDLVVAHDKWAMVSPTKSEGGLLCPSCMCKRAFDAGVECPAKFTSGPFTAHEDAGGMVLVPREPTWAMQLAGDKAAGAFAPSCADIYRAMIEAKE